MEAFRMPTFDEPRCEGLSPRVVLAGPGVFSRCPVHRERRRAPLVLEDADARWLEILPEYDAEWTREGRRLTMSSVTAQLQPATHG